MEPVQSIQMNIYRSNTCRKDLNWLHFDNDPKVQESQQVKDQQSHISVSVVYLTYLSSTSPGKTTVLHACQYGSIIDIKSNLWRKKPYKMNQVSNLLRSSFSNRGNVRAPNQI